ncbi:MAG: TetR family transcriptional regulator [Clostridium sp.]|nr:TetR family transcriptional regulator [Clostridium sp.]
MDEVRCKILLASKELFFSQGYKKTTIRQIVEKSGVLIGSIYHFFRNKEDIFQAVVFELFNKCESTVNKRFAENKKPALSYAVMCAIELRAVEMSELVCEFYYEAYSSNIILEKLTTNAAKRSQILFKMYNPNYIFEDYYVRTLMIKGVVRSCIASCYFKQKFEFDKMINIFLEISLRTFNVDEREIEEVLGIVARMKEDIINMALIVGDESFSI